MRPLGSSSVRERRGLPDTHRRFPTLCAYLLVIPRYYPTCSISWCPAMTSVSQPVDEADVEVSLLGSYGPAGGLRGRLRGIQTSAQTSSLPSRFFPSCVTDASADIS